MHPFERFDQLMSLVLSADTYWLHLILWANT